MRIAKFGGTSVGSPDAISQVIRIIQNQPYQAVVVSAFSGVTDQLIRISQLSARHDNRYLDLLAELRQRHTEVIQSLIPDGNTQSLTTRIESLFAELADLLHGVYLLRECSLRSLDYIQSFGEQLSAVIITETARQRGIEAEYLDARRLIITDENFGRGRVLPELTEAAIQSHFRQHSSLQVMTGFIASTRHGETTTLGRGGSDYTAAVVGAALQVEEIEIWTDVNGIMTADPRKVKKAFSLDTISFEEAMEMSHFGAKIIYPPTIQPAMDKKIPIRIKNTFNPDFPGTTIQAQGNGKSYMIRGISSIQNIALLRVQGSGMIGVTGIAMRLFSALAREKVNVILITQASSEHSICLATAPESADKAKAAIEQEFDLERRANQIDEVLIETDLSILAVVGEKMKRTVGISGRLFHALGRNGINVVAIAQGSSELNISVVINRQDECKALNAIHDTFFLSETRSLNLFMTGCGLIGSTLLKQIRTQMERLRDRMSLDIKLIGLSNSRKRVMDENGIDLDHWKSRLEQSDQTADFERFIQQMKDLNLPNTIFIDCTADQTIAERYGDILEASISVVTPNKRANTGSYHYYQKLNSTAARYGARFLYETNVGAGLPIISTLHDLTASGDSIHRIEAILSGTISYIFNNFKGDTLFSHWVEQARRQGLTEPDPRDDLNALDAARKLLILARETGLPLELNDIHIQPILPEECLAAENAEQFMKILPRFDDYFSNLKNQAEQAHKALRYIARLEK